MLKICTFFFKKDLCWPIRNPPQTKCFINFRCKFPFILLSRTLGYIKQVLVLA